MWSVAAVHREFQFLPTRIRLCVITSRWMMTNTVVWRCQCSVKYSIVFIVCTRCGTAGNTLTAIHCQFILQATDVLIRLLQGSSQLLDFLLASLQLALQCHDCQPTKPATLHTHTFNGPLSETTRVGRYQKGKTSGFYWSKRHWVAVASAWLYASLHLALDNHASQFFYRPDALPATQPTVPQQTYHNHKTNTARARMHQMLEHSNLWFKSIRYANSLLFDYQCTSGEFIRLPNRIKKIDSVVRIESKLFFARIVTLYQTWGKQTAKLM